MYLVTDNPEIRDIERAMVAMRRSQNQRRLLRLARQRAEAPLAATGFEVLDLIEAAESDGRPLGVGEVAAGLGVDQPRASRLVAVAVERGHAERVADEFDGRRTRLVCTAEGRAVLEQAHRFRRGLVAEATADWSAVDRAEFARLFTEFTASLARLTDGNRP